MSVRSPFEGLRVPKDLICEFFGTFARFEYALKEMQFVIGGNRDRAMPDWDRFAMTAATWFSEPFEPSLAASVEYLCGQPPQVQAVNLRWKEVPLAGTARIEQALHAVTRVRNNLFHGGKHTAHSPNGRDQKLVECSLHVLHACLQENPVMAAIYDADVF